MKTETHTPGPWSTVTTESGNFEVISADSVVVVVLGSDEKSEPDARLIAAAPDLLAALEMALVWLDYEGKYDVQGIRAAIAKARGEA